MSTTRREIISITTSALNDGLSVRIESISEANDPTHPLLQVGGQPESTKRRIFYKHDGYQVRTLTVYMASEASRYMPNNPYIKTGPSGIQVKATFYPNATSIVGSSSLLEEFQSLLHDLAESQIIPGPFGLSLTHHRLHRLMDCHETSYSCTAHVPLEGAHTVASVEAFQHFLRGKESVGVLSVASPKAWSTWWLANAPQSLEDSRKLMASTTTQFAAYSTASRVTPIRPARWIQWNHECDDDSAAGSSHYSVSYGIQYEVLAWDLQWLTLPIHLSNLLPTNSASSLILLDPFADSTIFEIDHRVKFTVPLSFDDASKLVRADTTLYSIAAQTMDLSDFVMRSLPIFSENDVKPCSLHSRILRNQGQGNTGALELYLENGCIDRCTVLVEQSLPSFLAPRWRSLQLFVNDNERTQTFRNLDSSSHIDFIDDGSSRINLSTNATSLRLVLDYDPVFSSIDSLPGDTNRGFELPPAKATFHCRPGQVLYADAQLLLSPLPDMSMPFNVISLTCTFYAFIVGSIINLAIKKASKHVKDQLDPDNAEPDSVIGKVRSKLVKVSGRIMRGVLGLRRQKELLVSPEETAKKYD